jgi:PAS domain S-box-containing protein
MAISAGSEDASMPLKRRIRERDPDMFQTIVDNCFGNIFVTDGKGKIIYLNESSAASLGYPREVLLGMTIYDLAEQGIARNPASITVIETGKPVIRLVPCRDTGISLAAVSSPVFDEAGNLQMVVTYSQSESKLNGFIECLDEERRKAKEALQYLQNRKSPEIVSESPSSKRIFAYAERVAESDSTVMLYGESGTGKEVLAHYIHKNSRRQESAFLPINCAAIPAELMEAEFFGYERGAFTGALKDGKPGIFELADGGTLFLDEIGELPLPMQSKLLRVLGTGEVIRVGGGKVKQTDVLVIAATNRDLRAMTKQGSFREDLFYRLNVIPITIPPLRERPEDILILAQSFLDKYNKKYGYHKSFTPETMKDFCSYHWPGNVRELKNVVERFAVTSPDDRIKLNSSQLEMGVVEQGGTLTLVRPTMDYGVSLKERVAEFEEQYIRRVLEDCGGNVAIAAERLEMHRSGLYKKMKKFK